jgi:hypothetical protein
MAKNLVALWNLALGVIGTRARLTGENDTRYEAEVIKQWYEPVRNIIFSAAYWNSVRAIATLPVLAERDFNLSWQEGDPDQPWAYAYGLPADFVCARYLDSYSPFELSVRGNQRVLLSNAFAANLIYTAALTNVSLWSDDLYMAVAHGLGAAVCQQLNGKRSLAASAQNFANEQIIQARVKNANEADVTYDHVPDWLIARGVGLSNQVSRFINPTGAMLAVVSTNAD